LRFALRLGTTDSEAKQMAVLRGTPHAPEFPAGLDWLNTDGPLRLDDLRGKVVLLDFWASCCINCLHVIPDLKRLERKYSDELVVIGVHSAKFSAERETDTVRTAILRYEIEHPVVNDSDMRLWELYEVRAWPTLVLIDPAGRVVSQKSGEGAFEVFDGAIAELIAEFDERGEMDRRPLEFARERERLPASALSFPGKVLADAASDRLFIADSNHNRILIVSLGEGALIETIGSGDAGLADGDFSRAAFDHPQGLALNGESLYVADTGNHAIRRLDLARKRVETIAGTGGQATICSRSGPGPATSLNSPWALVAHDGALYVAMAGSHQIWRMDLATQYVQPHAGSGREGRVDGPLLSAALAQPSGLTTDGERLYIADSEVSAVRAADIHPDGRVETIVGGDLFEFGDRDGTGLDVRLQHPLGIACDGRDLYVADTYNNKIKRVHIQDGSAETFLGTGEADLTDGDRPEFHGPAGISVANGMLYIADTNNHAIRAADLRTGRVETFRIRMPA
jgi:thiol-disulfide isomerase/thioredoxin/sugar lactone lactonase YvrE